MNTPLKTQFILAVLAMVASACAEKPAGDGVAESLVKDIKSEEAKSGQGAETPTKAMKAASESTTSERGDLLDDADLFGEVSADFRHALEELSRGGMCGTRMVANMEQVALEGEALGTADGAFDVVAFLKRLQEGPLGKWKMKPLPLAGLQAKYGTAARLETEARAQNLRTITITWHEYENVCLGVEGGGENVTWIRLRPDCAPATVPDGAGVKAARLLWSLGNGQDSAGGLLTPGTGLIFLMVWFEVAKADTLPVVLDVYNVSVSDSAGTSYPAFGISPVNKDTETVSTSFKTPIGYDEGVWQTVYGTSEGSDHKFEFNAVGSEQCTAVLTLKTAPTGFVLFFVVPAKPGEFHVHGLSQLPLTTGNLSLPPR